MVYSHQFVCAVKVDGSILRESAGAVAIPFGSEYSIYLKNMATVRAMVKVEIDGTDVTEGTWLVINPNSNLDLERFLRNGNLSGGNRFKFIKRTGKIEQHRGVKAEDGLVRIEYKFEKLPDPEVHTHHYHHNHWPYYYYWYPYYPYYPNYPYNPSYPSWRTSYTINSNTLGSAEGGGVHTQAFNVSKHGSDVSNANVAFTNTSGSLRSKGMKSEVNRFASSAKEFSPNPGITVEGSQSNQRFFDAGWFPTEETSHIIVLKLFGAVKGRAVKEAVTVKTKTRCVTCETVNKSGVKFCKECGTSLEII